MKIQYPKGSEWRKWDLHIHTPCSIHQNYGGDTPEVWGKFINSLENLPQEVKVIGINDYYWLEGFKKVMAFKALGRLKNLEKIFPVVEFRISTFASANKNKLSKVNLHVLFDIDDNDYEKEVLKINDEFLANIKISSAEGHETKKLNNKQHFINCSPDKKLKSGLESLIPPIEDIKKVLKVSEWQNKTFIFIGYNEWDNLDHGEQLKIEKQEIYKLANAFFTGSKEEDNTKKINILKNFGNTPLIHSMDIHGFDDLNQKNIDNNYQCFTWIKADPTFEGLKQITYEPEQRVHISDIRPDRKNIYQVIDSIEIIHPDFLSKTIPINNNFVSIIGCRSSGKSLLMYHIAKAINSEEVNSRFVDMDKKLPYSNDEGMIDQETIDFSRFDLIVNWSDKSKSQLSDNNINSITDNEIETENRKPNITYIPQGYLSSTAERNQDAIDNILLKFLIQDENFQNTKSKFDTLKNQISISIVQAINNMFDIIHLAYQTKNNIGKIGNVDSINKNVAQIEIQLKDISEKCNLTEAQRETRMLLEKKLADLKLMQENIQSDIENKISENDLQYIINEEFIFKKISIIKTDHKEKLHIDINNVVSDFKKSLKNIFQAHNTNLTASLDKTNQEYQNTEKLLSPIRQKLKAQSGIDALQKQLNEEQKKLSELETLEKRDKEYRNKFIEYRQTINDLLKKRINAYKQFTEDASAFTKSINENSIETNIRFNFSEDLFLDQLKKKINKSKHKNIENDIGFEQIQNNFKNNQYDEFIGNLMDVQLKVTTLSENKIHLNYSGQEEMGVKKEVLLKIFSDYFKINYNVKYEGDTLKNMSTGTRSLFLLKLIMQLSNSRHPILIDQPEDDLDNSSVYHKLVEFIKTKKKERQIIIVTHNPNLVIGTDAEQVIVGQQSSNQSGKKFNYIYGAIENSFERNKDSDNIADHGIKQNICRILEGGDTAFLKREKRYGIN